MQYLFLLLTFFSLNFAPLLGEENEYNSDTTELNNEPLKVTLISETESVQPGKPFWVALRFQLSDGWHTYWDKPGSSGKSPRVKWDLPEGFQVSTPLWPSPLIESLNGENEYVYRNEFTLIAQITPTQSISNQEITLGASVRWVVCSETMCMPGSSDHEVIYTVLNESPRLNEANQSHFADARDKLPKVNQENLIGLVEANKTATKSESIPESQFEGGLGFAILLAFVGGIILNLMPCVLPVISFKILSFIKMSGKSRFVTFQHGLFFSLGVLVSFWILAGALLLLQYYGQSVGWGFQLQEPLFVAVLTAVLVAMSLSLFGVFEAGSFFNTVASRAPRDDQTRPKALMGSFFSGVLATAVATPCTGPFLGSAVGFAVTQPPFYAMLIFTSLGLGMALPYLLLSAFPKLIAFLPKPGNWMVTFKEFMGFILLATSLWLMWVFASQTGSTALIVLLIGLLLLALGCWVYGKYTLPTCSRVVKYIGTGVAALFLSMSLLVIFGSSKFETFNEESNNTYAGWERFSPELVAELQSEGKPVFVDFTAKWCLICQANHAVLTSGSVATKLDQLGVVRMKADWTNGNQIITKELKRYGRSGVPLYLLYGPNGGDPVVLPQVLTPDVILSHLEKM